ncbi:MAG: L-threonylcarbamoyladenylate synthase [Candidatus Geothermincolales bacterium]
MRIHENETGALQEAISVLERDGLVVVPTDTVYGVAARADSAAGVARIFEAKGRDWEKAIVVMVHDAEEAVGLVEEEAVPALRKLSVLWPGPLTLVLPAREGEVKRIVAPLVPTIGIRIPDHPFLLSLLRAAGPLAVTSANLSGRPAPASLEEMDGEFLQRVDLVLDGGPCRSGVPSTVAEIRGGEVVVLRVGEISGERLMELLDDS